MSGFGGMVSFVAAGGEAAALSLVAETRLFTLAESLGAVESLIEHPAEMTHASTADSPLAVDPALVRLSVGLETADRPGRRPARRPRHGRVAVVRSAPRGTKEEESVMAKFVQIIQYKTSKIDESARRVSDRGQGARPLSVRPRQARPLLHDRRVRLARGRGEEQRAGDQGIRREADEAGRRSADVLQPRRLESRRAASSLGPVRSSGRRACGS